MGESKNCTISSLMWWVTLLVAVLAVPSIAIIVTMLFAIPPIAQVLVFVLTCWVSTYLGMRLMQDPKMQETIGSGSKQ